MHGSTPLPVFSRKIFERDRLALDFAGGRGLVPEANLELGEGGTESKDKESGGEPQSLQLLLVTY